MNEVGSLGKMDSLGKMMCPLRKMMCPSGNSRCGPLQTIRALCASCNWIRGARTTALQLRSGGRPLLPDPKGFF